MGCKARKGRKLSGPPLRSLVRKDIVGAGVKRQSSRSERDFRRQREQSFVTDMKRKMGDGV